MATRCGPSGSYAADTVRLPDKVPSPATENFTRLVYNSKTRHVVSSGRIAKLQDRGREGVWEGGRGRGAAAAAM